MPRHPASSVRPSRADLLAAADRTVADVIAPGLRVLFCGINPGLYSALTGHHFANPGNRFWRALHAGGFTDVVLAPSEERRLLEYGCGVTNLVRRATARADELDPRELEAGGRRLAANARRYRPRWVAVVGIAAYRIAFGEPQAAVGPQRRRVGPSRVWLLPNPSGLNASYGLADLAREFGALHRQLRRERDR